MPTSSSDSFDSFVLIQSPESDSNKDNDKPLSDDEMSRNLSSSCESNQTDYSSASVERRVPLQRYGVSCNICLEEIRGKRWICIDCGGWNLCESCFYGISEEVHPFHTFVRVHSAEDVFASNSKPIQVLPVVHLDVLCSSCQCPILGVRYECIADICQRSVNLCQACELLPLQTHKASHPMIKYKVAKEKNAESSMLDSDTIRAREERKRFDQINQPIPILNKGLWHLPEASVVDEQLLQARNVYSMEIERDKETPWGSHVSPGSSFARSWDITNKGSRPWPKGTSIKRVSPAVFTPPHFDKRILSDDVVLAGGTVEIRFVGLTAPVAPRTYIEVWALSDCEDRLFGERLEIRVYVSDTDKHASDRYFELERALEDVEEGRADLDREQMGVTPYEICKMRVLSSTLTWDKPNKTISCSWCIQNVGKVRFPTGCQVRRVVRAVGKNFSIDCSYAKVSVPQGLYSDEEGIVSVDNLKLVPSSSALSEAQDECQLNVEHRNVGRSLWVSETWALVDGEGKEFGERLDFAQSFQQTEINSEVDFVRSLVSEASLDESP